MKRRKIAIVTGSRADYGLLYWVIRRVQEDPTLDLQLIVTGMHLSPEFGMTVKEIERDDFPIADRVEMLLSSDTEAGVAASIGVGIMGFAQVFQRSRPDVLVLLGDRFEMLAAACAAVPFRIPIAHIHGGESTEGAMDEVIRHALTKMSHFHFPAAEVYARRIVRMGEDPSRVFCVGSPGLDHLHHLKFLTREEIGRELGLREMASPIGVVTYHPVTLEEDHGKNEMAHLLEAINQLSGTWIFTVSNADPGGRELIRMLETFVKSYRRGTALLVSSLGTLRYWSLLRHADVMVGNSSSGLTEAPSFKLPVVNIGDRQKGRIKAENVMDVPEGSTGAVMEAIRSVLEPSFRESLRKMTNPYGNGQASAQIVERLKTVDLGPDTIKKRWVE